MGGVARSSRGNYALGDIIRSVVVLAGVLAVGALLFNLVNDAEPHLPEPVDYAAALDAARAEYDYPVLAPEPLPDGWRATSVEFDQGQGGDRWRLGFLTAEEQYVGLHQSDGEIESFQDERLGEFTPDGESNVAGQTWQRWVEQDDAPDHALSRVDEGAVTIVIGTMSYASLEDFVASLR